MGLKILLLDKSEITEKMILHSLKHLAPVVQRFEKTENLLNYSHSHPFDVILAEWELEQEGENQSLLLKKENISQPIVILYRTFSSKLDEFPFKIKKPIDVINLRKILKESVKELQNFSLDEYLEYPESETPKDKAEESETPEKTLNIKNQFQPLISKDEIDFDPDTENDFAPTALQDSSDKKYPMNKELIKEVLEEYKETLEFENIISSVLEKHGEVMVKKIISDKGKSFIEQSFRSYKQAPEFKAHLKEIFKEYLKEESDIKDQVSQTLQSFIETKLPGLAKRVIEDEVQKLLQGVDS